MDKDKRNNIVLVALILLLLGLGYFTWRRYQWFNPPYSPEINAVLSLAGNNRLELEKVLNHYSQNPADSLKLKAAVFLIENMPGHYSYKNQAAINRYYDAVDSAASSYQSLSDEEIRIKFEGISAGYAVSDMSLVQDLYVITSDFLIDNIDHSFAVWQNGTWAGHVTFDDFCEYILPYKAAECQSLDNWREYLSGFHNKELDYLQYCSQMSHAAYWASWAVNTELSKAMTYRPWPINTIPVKRLSSLLTIPTGKCEDYTLITTSLMRAKGIPVVEDFTRWPNRNLGHTWCVLLDNGGNNSFFNGAEPIEPSMNLYINRPLAKVFRHTYAINPDLLELNQSEQYVPETFRSYFYKDVTDEYERTDDVKISLTSQSGNYSYLCVFNNLHWTPVHWGKTGNKKALFKKMGRDVVYLPCSNGKQGLIPAANPFILTLQGEVKPIVADTTRQQTLKLYRKHPAFLYVTGTARRIVDGKIQAANRPDFSDSITLHTIDKYGTESDEIRLSDLKEKYRYWRYLSPPNGFCNIAEMYFFHAGELVNRQGKVMGTNDTEEKYAKKNVFDNDPLTHYSSEPLDGWVGLDFGEPVAIDCILYIPRNDGNGVTCGDEYELKYWDNKQWHSLGRKVADNIYITYDYCPTNALFLLHDCTRGKDDRIFTYENGKQVFW